MNAEDLKKISLNWLKSLAKHCETLISENRAGLEEYELYVRCQIELVRRGEIGTDVWPSVREHGLMTRQYGERQ